MFRKLLIRKNTYQDSVALMRLSTELAALPGIVRCSAIMGTPQNLVVLAEGGLLPPEGIQAGPSDLVVAVAAEMTEAAEQAVALAEKRLAPKGLAEGGAAETIALKTLRQAVSALAEANMVLVSTPGPYAAAEAMQAIKQGLHVMIFSDSVALEDEVTLKKYGVGRGLLVMGPDCGTAVIGGRPVGFANQVRSGSIGLVGASGTGLQQVMCLVDRLGEGISHAIGVGSRDLSEAVGGLSMLQAMDMLLADPATRVLVLLSKPAAPAVVERILRRVAEAQIPVVVNFLGGDPTPVRAAGAIPAATLEEGALAAVSLLRGPSRYGFGLSDSASKMPVLAPSQRFVRGAFAGGTLAHEAILTLVPSLGAVNANFKAPGAKVLSDPLRSEGHTVVDYGADEFTVGRPHPMIDGRLRAERVRQEGADPETAVLLLDFILGYGSNADPVGSLLPAIQDARAAAKARGGELAVVASVCGTAADPQGLQAQEAALREAGVLVAPTNAGAARIAVRIIKSRKGGEVRA